MKKVENVKQLVDERYQLNKSKTAISINKTHYIKNINYFNYKFDIYSMLRSLENKHMINKTVAILSENRYEFMVTYLANSVLGNKIIIFNTNCSATLIEKTIKKKEITTIFYSNKYKKIISEIFKLENNKINSKNKNNKIITTNLINFDPSENPKVIEYEKFINTGRYIENYSMDKIQNKEPIENCETVFVSKDSQKIVTQFELIDSVLRIKNALKILNKRNKRVNATANINTIYELIVECLLPYYYGISVYFYNDEIYKNDIVIESSMQEALVFLYKNKRYRVSGTSENMALTKIESSNKNFIPKLKVLRNKNGNTVEHTVTNSKELVLIKAGK